MEEKLGLNTGPRVGTERRLSGERVQAGRHTVRSTTD
jgi:hypothetical protein